MTMMSQCRFTGRNRCISLVPDTGEGKAVQEGKGCLRTLCDCH